MAMDEAGVQQAWNMMSQHNDALMLRVEELEEQLRKQSILHLIKIRFLYFIGRM